MTDRPSSIERAAGRTVEGLDSVFGPASPAAVFSEPERLGDDLIITAASWERAGGFGFGGGGNSRDRRRGWRRRRWNLGGSARCRHPGGGGRH